MVGLWGPRGPELLICQIAIAKTGAAWLPFDGDAPVERIEICLRDAEAKGLLTSEVFAAKARGHVTAPILTEADLIDPADQSVVDARKLGATPDHPAYMIYTSGSTGTPKGIVITGRNICHYLRSANETYKIGKADIVFQGASIAFDLSMEEIWIPYLAGATLFVATPEVMGEAEALPDLMEEVGVTVLDTVPTLLSLMPRDIKTLRVIILGGEACPPAVAKRWCKPGRTIFNSYGPTEATVVATVAEVRPDEPVTIGGPDRQLHLLCRRRGQQPAGARRRGRTADRRPGRGARLSQARRADGGKIHRQSLRFDRRPIRSSIAPATPWR